MKTKDVMIFLSIFLILFLNSFAIFEDFKQRKQFLDFKTNTNQKLIKIENTLSYILENLNIKNDEVQESLSKIEKQSDLQFLKTVEMKNVYDGLLLEQQKTTIDVAEKDTAIEETRKLATENYAKKDFFSSYEEYKKVLLYFSDDIESRIGKAKSLYFRNPYDSTKYAEILADITMVKNAGKADKEILEIEKTIKAEQGGLYE